MWRKATVLAALRCSSHVMCWDQSTVPGILFFTCIALIQVEDTCTGHHDPKAWGWAAFNTLLGCSGRVKVSVERSCCSLRSTGWGGFSIEQTKGGGFSYEMRLLNRRVEKAWQLCGLLDLLWERTVWEPPTVCVGVMAVNVLWLGREEWLHVISSPECLWVS